MKVYNLKYKLSNGNVNVVNIAADNFVNALEESIAWFQKEFGGDNDDASLEGIYDIQMLEEVEGINIVNLEVECDCPACLFERGEEEGRMEFDCACNNHIGLAGDWEMIMCNQCQRRISKDEVVYVKGKWVYIPKDDSE